MIRNPDQCGEVLGWSVLCSRASLSIRFSTGSKRELAEMSGVSYLDAVEAAAERKDVGLDIPNHRDRNRVGEDAHPISKVFGDLNHKDFIWPVRDRDADAARGQFLHRVDEDGAWLRLVKNDRRGQTCSIVGRPRRLNPER